MSLPTTNTPGEDPLSATPASSGLPPPPKPAKITTATPQPPARKPAQMRTEKTRDHRVKSDTPQTSAGLNPDCPHEVLLDGRAGQQRLARAFDGLSVLWVGVRCDPAVAAQREHTRPDRIAGMAAAQATAVHDGVRYDVVVDTTNTPCETCASAVVGHVGQGLSPSSCPID
jgi:hypothetical protein